MTPPRADEQCLPVAIPDQASHGLVMLPLQVASGGPWGFAPGTIVVAMPQTSGPHASLAYFQVQQNHCLQPVHCLQPSSLQAYHCQHTQGLQQHGLPAHAQAPYVPQEQAWKHFPVQGLAQPATQATSSSSMASSGHHAQHDCVEHDAQAGFPAASTRSPPAEKSLRQGSPHKIAQGQSKTSHAFLASREEDYRAHVARALALTASTLGAQSQTSRRHSEMPSERDERFQRQRQPQDETDIPHGGNARKTSRYRGVSWHRRDKRWTARVWVDRYAKHLGAYASEDIAAVVVDLRLIAAERIRPGFISNIERRLNFATPEQRYAILYAALSTRYRSDVPTLISTLRNSGVDNKTKQFLTLLDSLFVRTASRRNFTV